MQLRRLSLRGDCSQLSKDEREFGNQLSTLSRLELLQVNVVACRGRPYSFQQLHRVEHDHFYGTTDVEAS